MTGRELFILFCGFILGICLGELRERRKRKRNHKLKEYQGRGL